MPWSGLQPELVWALFPRFVGVLYILAFGSLASQASFIGSSRGMLPVQQLLARVRRDYPGVRRFLEFPTVLWLFTSDRSLRAIPLVGVACGACMIYGGELGYAAHALAVVLWLSLELLNTTFPWDTMLMEAGVLTLFLPTTQALPQLAASSLPHPAVAFMVRWFVLRIMLGFGKDKFIGVRSDDSLYLRGFFVWMPLPNPLGWFAHHAPTWFLKVAHVYMFLVEIVAPVLGLFAGAPRLVAFFALTSLMIGIQATGNWGYFNLGYALLCVCLLDVNSSILDLRTSGLQSDADIALAAAMALLFAWSLVYLPLNSWFNRSWPLLPRNFAAWETLRGRLKPGKWLIALFPPPLRLLAPLRIVNGYGVFPPNSSPPLRLTPIFEGSNDGKHWKAYAYHHMPTFETSRPPIVAPLHPRLDMLTSYVVNALHHGGLTCSAMPYGSPYLSHARASTFDVLVQRLLENDPEATRQFKNPFPDAPPKLIRVSVVAKVPTSVRELRATGRWWRARRLGVMMQPRSKESWPEQLLIPEPECFNPDFTEHRRRSPALRATLHAHQAGSSPDSAILAGSDLRAEEVETFWNVLIPLLEEGRADWSRLAERADVVRTRFDVQSLYRQERILERLAWLLRCRIEAHPVASRQLRGIGCSNYRVHMMLHEAVADGRSAYLELLEDPTRFFAKARKSTDASQLWVLGLMRFDQFMQHVCAFRWSELSLRVHENELPGLFEYYSFLARIVPPDEEFCPAPIKHENGEHSIPGLYPMRDKLPVLEGAPGE